MTLNKGPIHAFTKSCMTSLAALEPKYGWQQGKPEFQSKSVLNKE